MGMVCGEGAAHLMRYPFRQFVPAALCVGLFVSLGLSIWSISRSESYRQQTEAIYGQALEIRSRISQSKEQVARITGYLELATKTGEQNFHLSQYVKLLRFNLKSLAHLEYAHVFLDNQNILGLQTAINRLDSDLIPVGKTQRGYGSALVSMAAIDNYLVEVASRTVGNSQGLRVAAQIQTDAAHNRLRLFGAVSALILSAIAIYHYNKVGRDRDHHIRSFSMLFAHMTRTRIAALRLFLGYLDARTLPPPEMTEAALRTILELDSITEALTTIGHARAESKPAPLGKLIEEIVRNCKYDTRVEADAEARAVCVPASQFHLLIDELVGNAINAVAAREDPAISIKATVKKRSLRPSQLILTVVDNGTGMSPDLLAKARDPFFSTKAGVHVGLGLTNCAELVKSMSGKLDITSAAGIGTSVRITYTI